MSKKTVVIYPAIRDDSGAIVAQHFFWPARVPHWKRFGEGTAHLRVMGHVSAGWVSLVAEEFSKESDKGRATKKQTMIDLDRAAAEALRDTLNRILGGSSREQRTLVGYPAINVVEGSLRSPETKTGRADGRVFSPSPVTRDDGDFLYAAVDQHGVESGDTPSHSRKLVEDRCKEINGGAS